MTVTPITGIEDVNLGDIAFWGRPPQDRATAFRLLREHPTPVRFPEPKSPWAESGPGYYALVRHADVSEANRNAEVFSSEPSALTITDMPPEFNEFFGSLVNMDDPRHASIRRIVSSSFSPRMMRRLTGDIERIAAEVVSDLSDALATSGPRDFVAEVSSRVPLLVILDMMGIPRSHYPTVLECSNVIAAGDDPELLGATQTEQEAAYLQAASVLAELMADIGAQRRATPTGDLTSALVNAGQDGQRFTDQELSSFFIFLIVAGNETVRTALSHGLELLTDNPDQRALLTADLDDRLPGAVEEILRLSSPAIWMRRTVTRDHELGGRTYIKGDKLVLYYWSANRDEKVFERPEEFDILRSPNPHLSFGGGPHFCLGAHLARLEMTVLFRELFTRIPGIRSVGEPDQVLSGFFNGMKRLTCDTVGERTGS
ncbi:cytochrome P450 [Streptomyces caeruleatus]|uniref:Cytochrome n=1 Tax=Streptomyces caeruleatus TaxID=661399 RepID=A0A117RS28_9ACTN|nr:cytochrome P450 [Streptomyces caeruleatus]KUO06142.1 cytochrome [Streptomyces caeruleatus]